jgi:two-component system OmpR family response regulator
MFEAEAISVSLSLTRAHLHALSHQPRVLIVEDDLEMATIAIEVLSEHGIQAHAVSRASEMDIVRTRERIDLLILDVVLPEEDGLSVCRRVRVDSDVPILMLSARGTEADRILGLELGADDYMVKPFASRELVARVRALLRRSRMGAREFGRRHVFSFEAWRLDPVARQLHDPRGVKISMTSAELDLLLTFCRNAGRVLSREDLIKLTPGFMRPMARSIDVHISRIRQKIERDPRDPTLIKTVRLGGYIFTPIVEMI